MIALAAVALVIVVALVLAAASYIASHWLVLTAGLFAFACVMAAVFGAMRYAYVSRPARSLPPREPVNTAAARPAERLEQPQHPEAYGLPAEDESWPSA